MEEALKRGELRCLVATSSLELGIDMGAIDLVVQIESPGSVARGLQRIGRAGHQVGAPSTGRIFPKYRGDLVECAVVTRRMRDGEIEETRVPKNALDVLSQQIVAACATDEWQTDDLYALVRRAYPYRELPRAQFDGVLDMLSGRYPSDDFAELRPRIVWDRIAGSIEGRSNARPLAVANAGTIPDRGLYGVFLVDGSGRVGELDEEMVYEARVGQVFVLGASAWRIERITRDRVLVSPAPGQAGQIPFWKGEAPGRPVELGRAIGAFVRETGAMTRGPRGADCSQTEHDLDDRAARNLWRYLRDQLDATRVLPSDRTIVVERFRDEIGDWRLCILSPFGGRVHAPWALALGALLRERLGAETQALWSDDGIVLHLPDADEPPSADLVAIDPDAIEDLVVRELGGSALYGARFRENAARALLIPRRRPGPAHAALAAAAEGAVAAAGGGGLRLVPDRARDLPRVPAGRVRPAGAARRCCRGSSGARSRWSRPRRRTGRRSPPRSCSTTSRSTCTRATRRRPSGGRRRCRSTASCCASCSAPTSCASCSTRPRWPRWRSSSGAGPGRGADGLHDWLRRVGDLTEAEIGDPAAVAELVRSAPGARRCGSPARSG